MGQNTVWKWKGKRWLFGFIAFWIVAAGGAGIISRSGGEYHGASKSFIILVVLLFAISSAINDRDNGTPVQKNTVTKVMWVAALWIGHAVLSVIMGLGLIYVHLTTAITVDRYSAILAGYIIIYFAMRRSTIFVEQSSSGKEAYSTDDSLGSSVS